jgi:hypothetical protein
MNTPEDTSRHHSSAISSSTHSRFWCTAVCMTRSSLQSCDASAAATALFKYACLYGTPCEHARASTTVQHALLCCQSAAVLVSHRPSESAGGRIDRQAYEGRESERLRRTHLSLSRLKSAPVFDCCTCCESTPTIVDFSALFVGDVGQQIDGHPEKCSPGA